jgi:hypothetical protein
VESAASGIIAVWVVIRLRNSPLSTILPLQGLYGLFLLRRALPYANAGCPVGAILVNIFLKRKPKFQM